MESDSLNLVIRAIGIAVIAKFSFKCSKWLYTNLLSSSTDCQKLGANKGAYVVITGASEGIGKGLAQEAAARGFNLVLISRSMDKLSALSALLKSEHPLVQIKLVAVDCSIDKPEIVNSIVEACKDLDVSVLFNNVAASRQSALEDQDSEEIGRLLTLNCIFPAKLTAALLPQLKQRCARSKADTAAIVNVSSFLSILPGAYLSLYSASKAFMNQFSTALHCELETSGITVISIRPAHVATSMSGIKETDTSLMVPSARDFAKSAWKKIGASHAPIVSPYFPHALQEAFATMMPQFFIRGALRHVLKPKQNSVKESIDKKAN